YGCSLGAHRTMSSVLVREKLQAREQAERRRVLYVGMTRAKELLVLSGVVTERSIGETVLGLLQEVGQGELGDPSTTALTIGRSAIPHTAVHIPDRKSVRRHPSQTPGIHGIDSTSIALLWHQRSSAWTHARATPLHVIPTAFLETTTPAQGQAEKASNGDLARLGGIIAHRILKRWDFA